MNDSSSHANNTVLLNKYLHDIRNLQSFSKDTLIEINNLSPEDRMKILQLYNKVLLFCSNMFENL